MFFQAARIYCGLAVHRLLTIQLAQAAPFEMICNASDLLPHYFPPFDAFHHSQVCRVLGIQGNRLGTQQKSQGSQPPRASVEHARCEDGPRKRSRPHVECRVRSNHHGRLDISEQRVLLSLTVAYIDSKWKLHHLSLEIAKHTGTTTGEDLAALVAGLMERHDLTGRVIACVTDCEPSMIKAGRLLEVDGGTISHIGCSNHPWSQRPHRSSTAGVLTPWALRER